MKRIAPPPAKRRCVGWTSWEEERVAALYPDYGALYQEMPNRTYTAVRQRARQLGLVRPRHIWTTREIERLRQAFEHNAHRRDLAKLFPDLRPTQTLAKARHLHLSRSQHLKDFDDPVLSMIRARAVQMKLTLSALDNLAGTGRYFQNSDRRFRLRHAARAVAVLDGSISIEWDDPRG